MKVGSPSKEEIRNHLIEAKGNFRVAGKKCVANRVNKVCIGVFYMGVAILMESISNFCSRSESLRSLPKTLNMIVHC